MSPEKIVTKKYCITMCLNFDPSIIEICVALLMCMQSWFPYPLKMSVCLFVFTSISINFSNVSITIQLIVLISEISDQQKSIWLFEASNRSSHVDVIYLDFCKAFDSVYPL